MLSVMHFFQQWHEHLPLYIQRPTEKVLIEPLKKPPKGALSGGAVGCLEGQKVGNRT